MTASTSPFPTVTEAETEAAAQPPVTASPSGFDCPVCGQHYGPDEDYCPLDGAKLRKSATLQAAAESANLDEEPVTTLPPSADDRDTAQEPTVNKPIPPFNPPHWSAELGNAASAAKATAAGLDKKDRTLFDTLKKRLGIILPNADDPSRWRMPPEVMEQGWTVAGSVESNPAWDRWPLVRTATNGAITQGQLLRYRTGSLTAHTTYQALREQPLAAVGTIHAHGTTDVAGARFDYEVTSLPPGGQPLSLWLSQTTPGESRARYLAPLLARLLAEMAEREWQPWVLYPDLLWLNEDRLVLSSVGGVRDLTDGTAAQLHYSAELQNSALLKRPFAAPELLESSVCAERSPLFGVGQLLSVALWGVERSTAEISRGALPFALIQDLRLSRWLMGCLWPTPDGRWSLADFQAALTQPLEQMAPLPPWASLMPGAATRAFSFAGQQFWRAEDLLHAAMQTAHWPEAIERIERLLSWLGQTPWAGQAALLRQNLHQGKSADWVLIRLIRTLLPAAPLTWRQHDFSDAHAEASLAALAQAALTGRDAALGDLEALFAADLRGAFLPLEQRAMPASAPLAP